MIREIKKDWKFFVVLAIAIIAIWMLAIYTVTINQKLYTKGSLPETVGSLQDISENTQIEQKFIAKENNLEKIKIEFEPYKEDSNVGGKVKIGIRNEQGNILKEKEITRNYVRDNTSYELKFQKQKNSQDKVYTIYIEFEDLHQNDKFYTVKYAENNETAVQMGIVPDDLKTSDGEYGTVITNAFGSPVGITGDDSEFIIRFLNVTKEGCIALATADWGNSASGLVAINIGFMSGIYDSFLEDYYSPKGCTDIGHRDGYGFRACANHLPLSPALAAQHCDTNSVWGYDNSFGIKFSK